MKKTSAAAEPRKSLRIKSGLRAGSVVEGTDQIMYK
jgi:hypothetical protein